MDSVVQRGAALAAPVRVNFNMKNRGIFAIRIPRAILKVCLRDMAKPHGLLVPVSSADCSASTPGLSTS